MTLIEPRPGKESNDVRDREFEIRAMAVSHTGWDKPGTASRKPTRRCTFCGCFNTCGEPVRQYSLLFSTLTKSSSPSMTTRQPKGRCTSHGPRNSRVLALRPESGTAMHNELSFHVKIILLQHHSNDRQHIHYEKANKVKQSGGRRCRSRRSSGKPGKGGWGLMACGDAYPDFARPPVGLNATENPIRT